MNITTLNISAGSIKVLAMHGKSVIEREYALPPGSIKNGLILEPQLRLRDAYLPPRHPLMVILFA